MFYRHSYPGIYHNLINDTSKNNSLIKQTSNLNEVKNMEDITYNQEDNLNPNAGLNVFPASTSNSSNAFSPGIKSEIPPPPKRPLTPYMRFSKCMWQQVKSDNPSLSVCEIGSTIGRMWRELSTEEKQRHNDDFTLDKVRYDSELKQYLKNTGLKSRDLIKLRNKNKTSNKGVRKMVHSSPSFLKMRNEIDTSTAESQAMANPHFGQSFFTLGTSFGMPMGMLSGFSQMWIRQQYPNQQILASMNLAQSQDAHSSDGFHGSILTPGINLPTPDYY